MSSNTLVVIAGPTAVGKTDVAVEVAREFGTVVVSADSRQLYREMTIGTAKPAAAQMAEVPHYFIDIHSIAQEYDAASYAEDALALIRDLFKRHKVVVLCGGSGLYIKGVCEGFDEMPEIPGHIRGELSQKYKEHGIAWLRQQLQALDPAALEKIDPGNPHRMIRAMEVKLASGQSILSFRSNKKQVRDFDIVKIGLELPRAELYARIEARIDRMIADGLLEEAHALYPMKELNALQTVGYQEIFDYMDGKYDLDECIRLLKRNSRRYSKRQLTWFKKDAEFVWFEPHDLPRIVGHIRDAMGQKQSAPGSL